MKRQLASLMLIGGLCGGAIAQTADATVDIAKEPRLQKPITAKLKMLSLPEALKVLSKESEVPLESSTTMKALKVTVLVKDEPAGVVLARIADLFHADWKPSGDGFRLAVANEWNSREAAYLAQEDAERRKEAEGRIQELMAGASIPYAQVQQELREGKAPKERLDALRKVQAPGTYLLGSMFARFSSADWKAFWQGRTMRVTDYLPDPNAPAPKDDRKGGGNNQGVRTGIILRDDPPPNQKAPTGTKVQVSATFDPATGRLRTNEDTGSSVVRLSPLVTQPYPTGDLAKTPFGRDALAWSRIEEGPESLKTPVSGALDRGDFFGGQRSMADLLAWLHEKTGVSIVADAFRTPMHPVPNSANVGAWLKNLRALNAAFVRTEQGFVMVRHGAFWRLRTWEIPEENFEAIEKLKGISLDDYASFAGSLTPEQAAPFRNSGVLTRFDPIPLRNGMSALRFYATLGSADRRAAISGSRLPFTRLSGSSREQFLIALDDQMAISMGQGLGDLTDAQTVQALGFWMADSSTEYSAVEGVPNGQRAVGPAKRMLFGTSRQDGVQFMLPIG